MQIQTGIDADSSVNRPSMRTDGDSDEYEELGDRTPQG